MSALLPAGALPCTWSVRAPRGDYSGATLVRTELGISMRFAAAAHNLLERTGGEVAWVEPVPENPRYEAWFRDDKGNDGGLLTHRGTPWWDLEIWQ